MRLNFEKLSPFIKEVDERNKDLDIKTLCGVSIKKMFIPSIANTVGTDMKTYKIVRNNQFAYGPVTSRNGDKISIALLKTNACIVSSSYTTFEIIDQEKLDPEYLMMWFCREEFDRYARYYSHGSVREIFGWDQLCDVELPVPHIDKQRQIVSEYNVINNRLKLKEIQTTKINKFANELYKQWFIDFEFPITKEYAASISKPDLEGKPYRSSGCEMKYSILFDKEIPSAVSIENLGDNIEINSKNINYREEKFKEIIYLDTGNITRNYIKNLQIINLEKDNIPSRAKRKIQHNSIVYSTVRPNLHHYGLIKNPPNNMVVSTGFCVINSKNKFISNELIMLYLSSDKTINSLTNIADMSVTTYPAITPQDICEILIPLPNNLFKNAIDTLNKTLSTLYIYLDVISQEKIKLIKLKRIIEKNLVNRV